MPIPRRVTRVNKHVVNPFVLRVVAGFGPLAVVRHVGRRSGRERRTPVLAFAYRDGADVRVVLALTYGPDVDWARNVDAAGTFVLERHGEEYRVDDVRRVTGAAGAALLPRWVRSGMSVIDVDEFRTGRLRRLARR